MSVSDLFVYKNSPKKMRELEEVMKKLNKVFEFPSGGKLKQTGSLAGITLDQAQGTVAYVNHQPPHCTLLKTVRSSMMNMHGSRDI